jgi:hypothetical protein
VLTRWRPLCGGGTLRCIGCQSGIMSYASQLLESYPRTFNVDAGILAATIDALTGCAQARTVAAADGLT